MDTSCRRPSKQHSINNDAASLTSFPDPSPTSPPQSIDATSTSTHTKQHITVSSPTETPSHPKPALNGLLEAHGEPSLFFDASTNNTDNGTTLDDATDPQTLSTAPSPVLQAVLSHHGAEPLIRRLAAALAQRDAHISALTRLAQEYAVPASRLEEAKVRGRRAEERRTELVAAAATAVTAAAPDDVVRVRSASTGSELGLPLTTTVSQGTMKGFTKLFGGSGKPKAPSISSEDTSRSVSRPRRGSSRPMSVDLQSVKSNESVGWTSTLFGTNLPPRKDSLNSRAPVELTTRHDKDQLPPTLSKSAKAPQEAEWNRFLKALARSRAQNGHEDQGSDLIGASHFGQEGREGQKKLDMLTRLVIYGIPMHLRHAIWMELSNTNALVVPNDYYHYLSLREDDEPEEIIAIAKDVPRTLTDSYDFYTTKGSERLTKVLTAFVGRYKDLGYIQGLNSIAGFLLLVIPSEEDAFWVLCNMVENYFPSEYFSRHYSMTASLADNTTLRRYLKDLMPQLNNHLDQLDIKPEYTIPIKWLFTAFASALPEALLLRIWDVWLCLPGQKHFVFNVALSLLSYNADAILQCASQSEYMSLMDNELNLPEGQEKITEFLKQAYALRKKVEDLDLRRSKEIWRMKRTASTEALRDEPLEAVHATRE